MISNIINNFKAEYKKNKIVTGVMTVTLILGVLSYLKPSYTESVWGYLGFTALNFSIIAILIFLGWWFYFRRIR